jgi:hypothetical protein
VASPVSKDCPLGCENARASRSCIKFPESIGCLDVRFLGFFLILSIFVGTQALAYASSNCDGVTASLKADMEQVDGDCHEEDQQSLPESSDSRNCPDFAHCHHTSCSVVLCAVTPLLARTCERVQSSLWTQSWTPFNHVSELFRPPTVA